MRLSPSVALSFLCLFSLWGQTKSFVRHHLSLPKSANYQKSPFLLTSTNNGSRAERTQVSSRNVKSGEVFLRNLLKGVAMPFPTLRRVVLSPGTNRRDPTKFGIGFSVKEGIIALLLYLLSGVLAYSFIFEKWSLVDSFYFSCVCLTTTGYGDLCPSTKASKVFTCLFGLGGIAFLGTAVATAGSSLIQAEVDAMQATKQTSKNRVMGLFDNMPSVLANFRKRPKQKRKKLLKRSRKRVYEGKVYGTVEEQELALWTSSFGSILQRLLPSVFVILGGATVMKALNDGWTLFDSVYYALVTASTIGFGDLAPKAKHARAFAIIYIPLAVAAAGELLSGVAISLVSRRQRYIYEKQLEKDLTIEHLMVMDNDGDGKITQEEYIFFMLIEMGRVDRNELEELRRQFVKLDVTRSGYLDKEDLKLMAELRGASVMDSSSNDLTK